MIAWEERLWSDLYLCQDRR